ncbi:HEAT repeat domain-containing protein [Pseudomonas aeruginosa]
MRSVEKLTQHEPTPDVLSSVRNALSDTDELVRLVAAEALGDWKDLSSESLLDNLLKDPDWLVRGEAAISLAKIGSQRITGIIEKKINMNITKNEKLRYACAAFIVEKESMSRMIEIYKSGNHRIKCATFNLLADAIHFKYREDKNLIRFAIKWANSLEERQVSVESTRKNFLKELEEIS